MAGGIGVIDALFYYLLAGPLDVLSSLSEQRRKLPKKKIADCTSQAITNMFSISRLLTNVGKKLNTFKSGC